MKHQRTMPGTARGAFALAAILALTACGELGKSGLGSQALTLLVPGQADDSNGPSAPDFSPQAIAADPSGFQIFTINALGLQAPARLVQENGPGQTWLSQSGFSASFVDGLLVATRGLGDDLMASDYGQTLEVLAQGGGNTQRAIDFLDDFDQISTVRFDCVIVLQGPEEVDLGLRQVTLSKFEESCSSDKVVFTNLYWLDQSQEILQSRQFVSKTVAYLRVNRL